MRLRRLLGECCPQYSSKLEDMKYQRAQKILVQLRSETNTILTTLSWSRSIKEQLDNAPVLDVSEVGEKELRHGRMNPDKFRKLTKEQRDSWIEFHEKLLDVAQRVVKDTESSVQTLNSFKDTLTLVVEPIEVFARRGLVSQNSITSLRERYFTIAQAIKSEGRIRVRYLRILQDSHSRELFAKWEEQLQREFNSSGRRAETLEEFLSITKSAVYEAIGKLPQYYSHVGLEDQRQDLSIVRSKLDIIKHRAKVAEEQTSSWTERARRAAFDNQPDKASEAERRRQTFETNLHLYKECLCVINELYEKLKAGLNSRCAV